MNKKALALLLLLSTSMLCQAIHFDKTFYIFENGQPTNKKVVINYNPTTPTQPATFTVTGAELTNTSETTPATLSFSENPFTALFSDAFTQWGDLLNETEIDITKSEFPEKSFIFPSSDSLFSSIAHIPFTISQDTPITLSPQQRHVNRRFKDVRYESHEGQTLIIIVIDEYIGGLGGIEICGIRILKKTGTIYKATIEYADEKLKLHFKRFQDKKDPDNDGGAAATPIVGNTLTIYPTTNPIDKLIKHQSIDKTSSLTALEVSTLLMLQLTLQKSTW